jgi:adenylate kinase
MHGFLDRMKANDREFVAVLIDLDIDLAIERIQHRRMCKTCGAILNTKLDDCLTCPECKSTEIYQRTDDQTLESIKSRIAVYTNETQPVIDHFETLGVIRHVNGDQDIESVFADILKIVSEK